MPLGLARDVPLADPPAFDAYRVESERASYQMQKGADGIWAGHFGGAQKLISLLLQIVQSWSLVVSYATVCGFLEL